MTIILDHCVPHHYLKELKAWGYTVSLLREHISVRSPDPNVLKLAQQLDAVILTVDTDFQNMKRYPPQNYPGIIVMRQEYRAQNAILEILNHALQDLFRDQLRGVLVIVEADGYRVFPKQDDE